jgi:hypothetical protein
VVLAFSCYVLRNTFHVLAGLTPRVPSPRGRRRSAKAGDSPQRRPPAFRLRRGLSAFPARDQRSPFLGGPLTSEQGPTDSPPGKLNVPLFPRAGDVLLSQPVDQRSPFLGGPPASEQGPTDLPPGKLNVPLFPRRGEPPATRGHSAFLGARPTLGAASGPSCQSGESPPPTLEKQNVPAAAPTGRAASAARRARRRRFS